MQSHDLESQQAAKGRLAGPNPETNAHEVAAPGPAAGGNGRAWSVGASAATVARALAEQPARVVRSLPALQRLVGNRVVQRVVALARQGDGPLSVSPEVEEGIHRTRGGGQPLDNTVRTKMEGVFQPSGGAAPDFSGVRVHNDGEADTLNRSVNARAFTTGQDIYFRQGAYSPGSSPGRELIAHELTHVVQQNGAQPQAKLTVSQPGDRFEQEADQMAHSVAQKETAPGPGPQAAQTAPVQRAEEEKKEEGMQAKAEPGGLQRQGDDEQKDEES